MSKSGRYAILTPETFESWKDGVETKVKEDMNRLETLTENVNDFGIPVEESAHIHYKELLNELLAAVEMHQAILAGAAEEGEEDPLQATVDKVKEALDPDKEPDGGEHEDALPSLDDEPLEPEMESRGSN